VVSNAASDAAGDSKPNRSSAKSGGGKVSRTDVRPSGGSGGLKIYKPSQGFYVRVGTAIGGGVIAVCGAVWLFGELAGSMDPGTSYYLPVQYGVAVGFLAIMALVLYWVVGLNAKANDFFIATEGEMKKVNWSTKGEIIKSTQVVIVTVMLLAAFLFLADLLFLTFFYWIKVIKVPISILKLIGIGS